MPKIDPSITIEPNTIPKQLKEDNWTFFALSEQPNPEIKCQNVVSLVRSLQTTIEYAGLSDYPLEDSYVRVRGRYMKVRNMNDYILHFLNGAHHAWKTYTLGAGRDPVLVGAAVEMANAVLEGVDFLVYDPRFTNSKSDSFATKVK